jgi:hypothetical protein
MQISSVLEHGILLLLLIVVPVVRIISPISLLVGEPINHVEYAEEG